MPIKSRPKTEDDEKPKSVASILQSSSSSSIVKPYIPSDNHNDFEILSAPKKQANMLIFGDAGTGKTSFCTRYAPDPIAIINVDKRDQPAVFDALQAGRKILRTQIEFKLRIGMTSDQVKLEAQSCIDKAVKNFEYAVEQSKKGNIRTILLDTATEYSEICKYAFDGIRGKSKDGAFGKDKDFVNQEWWRLFNLAREGNAHFIVTSRGKEIWRNQEPTGKFTFRCPEVVNDAADWSGQIRIKKIGAAGKKSNEFELEITKAGINISQLGQIYDKSDWEDMGGPFVCACYYQFENTSDVEDWK